MEGYERIGVMGEMGGVMGVMLKGGKKERKKVGVSGGVTGMFGIREGGMYGVRVGFKKGLM